jgi:hypothetical protein
MTNEKKNLKNLYEEFEKESFENRTKKNNENVITSSEIREKVSQIFKEVGKNELMFSVVCNILKKIDVKYEKLGYSKIRVSVLYKKMFKLQKKIVNEVEIVYIVKL